MDSVELLPGEIAEALQRGAVVVTANERAARSLRRGFDLRNRAAGLSRWEPPAVHSWDSWAVGMWRGLLVAGHTSLMLLNRTQEHAVWRGVLANDRELNSLRSKDSLAELAADAWGLLCSYGGHRRLREMAVSTDTRAFQRWAMEFERRCGTEGYLSRTRLEETLQEGLTTGRLTLSAPEIVLVGFDLMTPAQDGLAEAVRTSGVAVAEVKLEATAEQRVMVAADDERDELRTCARWVRGFLERRDGARVAVIVPGLETQRPEIDRVFREVLAPELEDISAARDVGPYEFSIGVPLSEAAMVAVALDMLRWVAGPLALEKVSGLLLSPYFAGGEGERGARAELDAFDLRRKKMLRPEVPLETLLEIAERSKRRGGLPGLLHAVRTMRLAVQRMGAKDEVRPYSEWAEEMHGLLEAGGWGVGTAEDSIEFQTRKKWESALDELSTLDFNGVRVRYRVALNELERIAVRTIFAPESREAPVQVMGPLEAAGCGFDAVWFLRAGELSWPVSVSANPLLPWQIQQALGMPGADPAKDRAYARQITRRVAKSAGAVVFSYAEETVEGRQSASTLLDGLGLESVDSSVAASPETGRVIVETESVVDDVRLPLLPDRVIRGGARILALQAACGFRAFAEQRLWAAEFRESELGMDAVERGNVVHKVLEFFWREVKTQEDLCAMSRVDREEVLDWAIHEGLRKQEELSTSAWDVAYVRMQHERLRYLLEHWLELEMERPPFSVKLQEDLLQDVQVGPLRLSVRVDRVDESEGGEIILDYKTGAAHPKDWMSERPDAPQLPLYAILSQAEKLAGVAFALVRPGRDQGLKGLATSEHVGIKMSKSVLTLDAQVEDWRRVLTRLAEDFYTGDVRVRPKSYPKTCKHCGQRLLCRLDATALEEDEEDSATEEVERG